MYAAATSYDRSLSVVTAGAGAKRLSFIILDELIHAMIILEVVIPANMLKQMQFSFESSP